MPDDDPPLPVYELPRTIPLSEVRASDVPRGLSPDDVATDGAETPPEDSPEHRSFQRLQFVGSEETVDVPGVSEPPYVRLAPPRLIPLQANPTVHVGDIRTRRFNLSGFERQSIEDVEDISEEFEAAITDPPFTTERLRGFDEFETPYGSLEWYQQPRQQMPGAVFHLRKRIRTLPEARSSLLSVLEARAKTAPPTWGERIMADDDEDG